MKLDVVLLPRDLRPEHLAGRSVVVFDVLRATTSMTAALSAGVKEIRIFGNLDAALAAGHAFQGPHLLCGERNALKPPGFDLGNSPGAFNRELHQGMTLLMSTTNGTVAILAARGASTVLTGALANADAVARALIHIGSDITLLCAGTEGNVSTEDVLGAGAVIASLESVADVELLSDTAWITRSLFRAERDRLFESLTQTRGGHNITRAGLTPDIAFCAKLNSFESVGIVRGDPPIVELLKGNDQALST